MGISWQLIFSKEKQPENLKRGRRMSSKNFDKAFLMIKQATRPELTLGNAPIPRVRQESVDLIFNSDSPTSLKSETITPVRTPLILRKDFSWVSISRTRAMQAVIACKMRNRLLWPIKQRLGQFHSKLRVQVPLYDIIG
jgi:hypothetical protein